MRVKPKQRMKVSERKAIAEEIKAFAIEKTLGLTAAERLRVLEEADALLGGLAMDEEEAAFEKKYGAT